MIAAASWARPLLCMCTASSCMAPRSERSCDVRRRADQDDLGPAEHERVRADLADVVVRVERTDLEAEAAIEAHVALLLRAEEHGESQLVGLLQRCTKSR